MCVRLSGWTGRVGLPARSTVAIVRPTYRMESGSTRVSPVTGSGASDDRARTPSATSRMPEWIQSTRVQQPARLEKPVHRVLRRPIRLAERDLGQSGHRLGRSAPKQHQITLSPGVYQLIERLHEAPARCRPVASIPHLRRERAPKAPPQSSLLSCRREPWSGWPPTPQSAKPGHPGPSISGNTRGLRR